MDRHGAASCAGADRPNNPASERVCFVSIDTFALMPDRRFGVASSGSKKIRSGTRCTTFTQLPLAFCGGRIANCAPVPGLTDCTVPWKTRSGEELQHMSH